MPLTFAEALRFAESRRVELPSEYYGRLQGKTRDMAFSIAGVSSRDQLQGVLDSLKEVQTQGLTFAQWQEKVRGGEIGLDLPAHRLDNIFRTNMQVHYNAGHWQQQQRFKSTRPYLMYDAVNDSRTRPSHLELDNVIRPIDDAFWASHYPPNGYRCRCSAISMTEAQARARGGVTEEPTEGWPKTDKGWDHNAAADPSRGVSSSAEPTQGGSKQLQQAMDGRQTPKTVAERPATKADALKFLGGREVSADLRLAQQSLANKLVDAGWDERAMQWSVRQIKSEEMSSKVSGHYTRDVIVINRDLVKVKGQARSVITHELGHHVDQTMLYTNLELRSQVLADYHKTVDALNKAGVNLKALVRANDLAGIESALKANKLVAVSPYSLMNESEWIAESFWAFVEKPQLLELVSPPAFRAFERIRLGDYRD